MASLVISVQAAGGAFHALGGIPGLASMSLAAMAKPLLGAAGAYFLCNTALVATRDRAVDAPVAVQGLE